MYFLPSKIIVLEHLCWLKPCNASVETFTLVSTDKAVNSNNIMGASKRVSELICKAYASQQTSTKFAIVRFGNVLNSSGSVVPLFMRQINKGGPVTLTSADVSRYFMTIPEAVDLVVMLVLWRLFQIFMYWIWALRLRYWTWQYVWLNWPV